MSYHYIEDKDFKRKMKSDCSNVINQLAVMINGEDCLKVKHYLVGSGAKHLETQNANEPVDLDYNLEILETNLSERELKQYVMDCFNKVLKMNGWDNCFVHDSKSAITTGKHTLKKGNKTTSYSIDVAIVWRKPDGYYRLIHEKTGNTHMDHWYWNRVKDSKNLDEKAMQIKKQGLWQEVREAYLNKKNMYLQRQDYDHPSFVCYIEAVNEVYSSLPKKTKSSFRSIYDEF